MGEESEALQDWEDGYQAEEHYDEQVSEKLKEQRDYEYRKKVALMESRYNDNKNSAIGAKIRCAGCGKRIIKRNYQTQFCRNKGQGNCKDKYWNNVPVKRRERAQFMAAYG